MLGAVLLLQTLILICILFQLKTWQKPHDGAPGFLKTLEETAQQIVADLEAKTRALEALLKQADSRIQAMSELQASYRIDEWQKQEKKQKQEGKFSVPPQYIEAYNLLQKGKTIHQVAKETQIAKGEIQLILDLTETQKKEL